MKFTAERKEAIVQYLLEKIGEGRQDVVGTVKDAFAISQSTAHLYLKELQEDGRITKVGRNRYVLNADRRCFTLCRSEGKLQSETAIYNECLAPTIKDLPDNVQRIWNYAFSEMVNNVIDHSDAEHLRLIVERNDLETSVSILDDGVGVFRKIREYFGLDSVEDAMIELSKGKLTTDSVHHSGEGVFFTSRIMDEFLLCSDGKIFTFNKYREETVADVERENPFSTFVYLSLANRSKKQLADVFNEYADVDNGFIKTKIRMKNVFESAPISRSQAKRICSRLEQFKEVEFDFEGIDFMGQGFAHEIFFVFAHANPDIRLTPLNMNPAVRKMYDHVKEM